MSMDFMFVDDERFDKTTLLQGDLLKKSTELANAIEQAHSFYASADNYTHFVVLTQSCDLVRRNGKPKAQYITIAAVRPLENALTRRVEKYSAPGLKFPIKICRSENKQQLDHFLERLLHNTEDSYFFIRAGSAPTILDDSCVFLPLSIALHVDHYKVCLTNKVAQLEDIFAAKLGWLVGNLYSRVGTPDIEDYIHDTDNYKKEFFEAALYETVAWLSPDQIDFLKSKKKEWEDQNPGIAMSEAVARSLLASVPDDFSLAIDRIVDILSDLSMAPANDSEIQRLKLTLKNDKRLKRMTRKMG